MATAPRKPNKPDTTAVFKTAMGAAVRAVAGKPELEVSFSADRPLLTADKARLANLPRLPTRRDIAIARGQGDAMAMRLASHDPDIHRKRSPAEPEARAAFVPGTLPVTDGSTALPNAQPESRPYSIASRHERRRSS